MLLWLILGTTVTVGQSTDTNQNVFIDSDSVDIRRGSQVTASFGAITTIGSVSGSHTFIDSGSLRLKDGSAERLVMDANGLRIGNQFSVDSSGNATFGGTLTIGNLVSSSAQLADAISGSIAQTGSLDAGIMVLKTLEQTTTNEVVLSCQLLHQVVLSSDGMSLKNAAADVTLATYGTTTTIGQTGEQG